MPKGYGVAGPDTKSDRTERYRLKLFFEPDHFLCDVRRRRFNLDFPALEHCRQRAGEGS